MRRILRPGCTGVKTHIERLDEWPGNSTRFPRPSNRVMLINCTLLGTGVS